MLSKIPCQLVCLSIHIFFFFETWRIAIRQFQVVWLAEDNHILKPLEASHKLRLCNSQGYDYLLPAPLHAMPISPSVFIVLSYRFFSPFPPIMSIQLCNHSKNSGRKQPPQKPKQHYTEPTFWGIFNIWLKYVLHFLVSHCFWKICRDILRHPESRDIRLGRQWPYLILLHILNLF